MCFIWEFIVAWIPVKMLLQNLTRKGPFFLHSCKIKWNLVGFCRNLAGILCKIPAKFLQNPTRSHKILQEWKKDLFLYDLARVFLLGREVYCFKTPWSVWVFSVLLMVGQKKLMPRQNAWVCPGLATKWLCTFKK